VADNVDLVHAKRVEERSGIARELIEMKVGGRLEDLLKPIWSGAITR
jgi:hypothetical protein